jgi:hypothetical protein
VNISQLVFSLFFFVMPSVSDATIFTIDSSKKDVPNCGMWRINPCKTYSYLMSSGCDANGCRDNIKPGDSVLFLKGTYKEKIDINFSGSAANPVIISCDTAEGDCVIDGTGIPPTPYDALVSIGPARYVVFRGMKIVNIPKLMYGIALTGEPTNNIIIKGNTIDGYKASNNLVVTGNKTVSDVTLLKNKLVNCPSASTGCTFFQETNRLAVVGNEFGPVGNLGNYDCNTIVGVNTGLVDGNTCRDSADGFDQGMDHGGKFLINVITRYNRVYGNLSARAFPISGQFEGTPETVKFTTGPNSIYKNVIQTIGGSCLQPYGGAQDIVFAYNTCINSGTYGSAEWLQTEYDYWVQRVYTRYSLFDSMSPNSSPAIVLGSVPRTFRACPPGDECPFNDNIFFMKERPQESSVISWAPSSGGTGVAFYFSMAKIDSFNLINKNSGNISTDPLFVNRSVPYTLGNVSLQSGSPAKDGGQPFCKASVKGTGNAIAVTCGANGPQSYFPVSNSFYRLSNADCKNTGIRSYDAYNTGCFDVQIEGCGIREVSNINLNTITFSGAPCAWTTGASVHVPWSGVSPDLGALEIKQ